MTALIDELKEEHAAILTVLNEIEEVDAASPEVWEKFKAIQRGLITHLQKEDKFIYLALKEAATNRPELKRLLDSADDDMKGITKMTEAFFKKYPEGGAEPQFKENFNELTATIRNRILNEENVFFIEYELLFQ